MPIKHSEAIKIWQKQKREWEATPKGQAQLKKEAEEAIANFEKKYGPNKWEEVFGPYRTKSSQNPDKV